MSIADIPFSEHNYINNDIHFTEESIHLPLTNTYTKNKLRYSKRVYKFNDAYGFDSETYQGTCKMLCRNKGKNPTLNNPKTVVECLDFLFYNATKKKIYRFFYNLDFDISAILKLHDNQQDIIDLRDGKKVEFGKYSVSYLKERLFSIRYNKHTVEFTDLFQFYKTSLNVAGKEFLGKEKLEMDGNLLNTDLQYWKDNLDKIEKYCLRDCQILADLAILVLQSAESEGIALPKMVCSSASFSKQHFMKHSFIPALHNFPKKVLEIAHYTYYGGHFETYKRGLMPYCELWDINSQYPTKIRELPSFKYGIWEKSVILPVKETYGFYYVKLSIPESELLPTIPIKIDGVINFPIGNIEGWYTWYDLDLMRDYILEISNGFEYKEAHCEYQPFKEEVDKLFHRKAFYKQFIKQIEQQIKLYNRDQDKRELRIAKLKYLLIKLTINALYGCFVETNKNLEGQLWGGKLFNPVYATFITAFGRWSVVKEVPTEYKKHVIQIHTDSITFDCKVNFLKEGPEIGLWDCEAQGKALIFGSGQYEIAHKIARRGLDKKKFKSWFNIIVKFKDAVKFEFKKRIMLKMGRALIWKSKTFKDVNQMYTDTKEINVNVDKKRIWNKPYATFGQMKDYIDTSIPKWIECKDKKFAICG